MEVTPGIVVAVVAAVVLAFILVRRGRRGEPPAPVDQHVRRAPGNTISASDERMSEPLVMWLLQRASEETGIPLMNDPLARKRITEAALKAMEELRTEASATVSLPFLAADAKGPRHFTVRVKRNSDSTFEMER